MRPSRQADGSALCSYRRQDHASNEAGLGRLRGLRSELRGKRDVRKPVQNPNQNPAVGVHQKILRTAAAPHHHAAKRAIAEENFVREPTFDEDFRNRDTAYLISKNACRIASNGTISAQHGRAPVGGTEITAI